MSLQLNRMISSLLACTILCISVSGCFSIRGVLNQIANTSSTSTTLTMKSHIPTLVSNINTQRDDLIIGSIVVGNQMFFFANRGKGMKLYSVDPAGTITQRSNTNDNGYGVGDDHNWANGFHYVGGMLYFDAFDSDGRIKF